MGKVDASYLSPHVNIAARLEGLTVTYGVDLLVSGDFLRCLSQRLQRACRHIDRITVKGSKVPIDIYSFDLKMPPCTSGIDAYIPMFERALQLYLKGDWP